ncbi:MAG: SLAC1 anion channel family protein [Candidatus Competibacteraceae bacterium]|nr:SLAC1 anion channel family protein [Candidatus Competibacteraceae bacterium]
MNSPSPVSGAPNGASSDVVQSQRLEHLPVAIFSTVMGTAGLALAWMKAHAVLGMPVIVGEGLRGVASALFILLIVFYSLKALRYPRAVKMEMRHPVRVNFIPTISISLLLLAVCYADAAPVAAFWLWVVGMTLHLCLTVAIFGSWIHHTHYAIQHINPAWFIPVVGNIIVPVAGVRLAASLELSWFFFSIGVVFWIVLMTIVLYRLIFHEPLPARLTPTLFILLAPPSVGFIAYTHLIGGIDAFARILYYTALFLGILLASNALRFLRLPFFISAWAYSFPLAALTLATLVMSTYLPDAIFTALGYGLLLLLSLVIGALAARTLVAVWRREICLPE